MQLEEAAGCQLGSTLDGNLNFEMRQDGTWLITVEMQGKE